MSDSNKVLATYFAENDAIKPEWKPPIPEHKSINWIAIRHPTYLSSSPPRSLHSLILHRLLLSLIS